MVSEEVVRDCNRSGAHNSIHKPISAIRERVMINPDMTRPKDRDRVTVSYRSPPVMRRRASHHRVPRGLTVMDMNPMHNNVGNVLDREARAVCDVDVDAAAVDGLEAVHDQLLLQGDHHVALEDDPERLVLDHGVAERSRSGGDGIVVAGVGYDVVAAVAAADRVAAESDRAVGEAFAAELPFAVAAPAVVDWVAGGAGEVA